MHIFRKYDIRGIYKEDFDESLFEKIGNALGQSVKRDIVVGRDSRLSSKSLQQALIKGILQTDANVMNIGEIPIPYAMHWAWANMQELAYITGSHKPKNWNGIKLFHYNGLGYSEEEQQSIKRTIEEGRFVKSVASVQIGVGTDDVASSYHNNLLQKIKAARPLKVILDCGNGSAGIAVKDLFEKAGFKAETLFGNPDGNFPNRLPDPKDDPLDELRKRVKNADLGIAYDGDGDRMFIVDDNGRKLIPEQASAVILGELLKHAEGPVLANVECNSLIDDAARAHGREVVRIPVGHTFLIEFAHKMKASYGVETAGHYTIPMLSPFDDAIAVSLYVAYAISKQDKPLHELIDRMPMRPSERLKFECSDEKKFGVVEKLKDVLSKEYGNVNTIDGIRVDMDGGWALIRASNTGSAIRLTVEGMNEKSFNDIKSSFSEILQDAIDSA